MGVLIKIDGVTFDEKYIIKKVDVPEDEPIVPDEPVVPVTIADYPVTNGLKGLYDLGGTAEATLVNHAPTPHINTADEKLESTVVVDEDCCTFTGAANKCRFLTYLRMPLENAITAVVLFRVQDGLRPILSNRTGGDTSEAVGVTIMNDRVLYGKDGNVEPSAISFAQINSNTSFAILAMSVSAERVDVYRYTNDALNNLGHFEGAVNPWLTGSTGNAVQIGGTGKSDAYQDADISLAAIHEGVLTDEQLEEVCEFVKTYGEQKGLTIE